MREQATASSRRGTRRPRKGAQAAPKDPKAFRSTDIPGVYERGPDGGEYFAVKYTNSDGKRCTQQPFPTKKAAAAWRARVLEEIEQGTYRKVVPVTFKEYAMKWADEYRGRGRTPIRDLTRATYRRQIEGAVEFLGGVSGRRALGAVTTQQVAAFIDHLYAQGHVPDTVQRHMTPLKMVMAQALREGRIITDPTRGIPLIPSDPSLMPDESDGDEEQAKALTREEVTALRAAVPADHALMVDLMLLTGFRISEVLGLRWKDVDRAAQTVSVRQRVVHAKIGPPKSKRSRRSVPVTEELVQRLRERKMAAVHSGDDDLIFGTASGKPAWASNHGRWFRKAATEAGVEWASFHNLRHTYASRLFHDGKPLTVVSALLGHSDPAFTLRTYIHVIKSDVPDGREIAAAIGL